MYKCALCSKDGVILPYGDRDDWRTHEFIHPALESSFGKKKGSISKESFLGWKLAQRGKGEDNRMTNPLGSVFGRG